MSHFARFARETSSEVTFVHVLQNILLSAGLQFCSPACSIYFKRAQFCKFVCGENNQSYLSQLHSTNTPC